MVAAASAAALYALATAAPASAHAILLSSRPTNGAVLERSPVRVGLRFSEPVDTPFGAIRVYDGSARRVDRGTTARPAADEVVIGLPRLASGTYTVAWRVISADTHPVHGAFVFSVGEASAEQAAVAARVLAAERTPGGIGVSFAVVRALNFALILLVAGAAAVLAFVVRDAGAALRRRLALLAALFAVLLVPAALAGIVLEGAEAGGFSIGGALHGSVIGAVLDTRFGQVWLARACVAACLAAALVAYRQLGRAGALMTLLLALALVASTTVAAHASTGGAWTWLADGVHVLAASAWTGGLAFTVLALALAGAERWPLAARTVPRFSTLALRSVAVLLAAGIVNAYLQVRAWRGLWETTYGVLVLTKAGLLLPLLVLGAYNKRFAVPRLRAEIASFVERRRFLRTAGAELALAAVVVGVTAFLVNEPPAKTQVLRSGPYATTSRIGPFELNLVIDPARTGANAVHIYLLGPTGQPAPVAEARIDAGLPEAGIGPLRLDTRLAGPGHYAALGSQLPLPGDWRVRVTVRRGEFDEWITTVDVPIRKEG